MTKKTNENKHRPEATTAVHIKNWVKEKPTSAKACGGGLYLRIRASEDGQSSSNQWYFRYTHGGKPRWMLLGTFPDTSLEEARKAARAARKGVDDGVDVGRERQRERLEARNAKTVTELANQWYEEMALPSLDAPHVVRGRLDNHIIPTIGKLALGDVRPSDVERVLRKVRQKYPAQSSNVLRDLRRLFKYAAKRELMDGNPAANFDLSDAGGTPQSRERNLSESELKALFVKMHQSQSFGRPNTLSVLLLLALCVRKMELLGARWSDFDLEDSVWNMAANKRRRGKRRAVGKANEVAKDIIPVPLAPIVVEWLIEAKVFAAGSEYVFPVRRISKVKLYPHVSPGTLNLAIKNLGTGIEHHTVHDIRRTARTHLSKIGIAPHIAERLLNHSVKGVEGVYDRYQYFNDRMNALTKWADCIVEMQERALKQPSAGRRG